MEILRQKYPPKPFKQRLQYLSWLLVITLGLFPNLNQQLAAADGSSTAGNLNDNRVDLPVPKHRYTAKKARISSQTTLPSGIAQNWWNQVQKNIQQDEYKLSKTESTEGNHHTLYQASNRTQNLRTYFDEDGLLLTSRTQDGMQWSWGLSFLGFMTGRNLTAFPATRQVINGNRIEYQRGIITEWYVNRPTGVEQGFTLSAPPKSGAGEITLTMAARGNTSVNLVNDDSLEVDYQGIGTVLRFGKLKAFDAQGTALPARFCLKQSALLIKVATSGAVYPITIDPIATTPDWQLEADEANAELGVSVAGAGDVNGDGFSDVIVGASKYDNGETDEGAVFVYYGSSSGLSSTADWKAESNQANSEFGRSVASAGDVNGDGYADIIIGAYKYDSKGAAFIFMGSNSGLEGTDTIGSNGFIDAVSAEWQGESDQASAQYGRSVAGAGDVNDDGYDDVIIGRHLYTWVQIPACQLLPPGRWKAIRSSPNLETR